MGTVHATAIVLAAPRGPRGLLLTGASGAGKSTLALALLDEWLAAGRFAALVADDRTLLEVANGRLLARAPERSKGLVERRGFGIERRDHVAAARLHLHVALGEPPERMPEPATSLFESITLQRIDVPVLSGPHGAAAQGLVRTTLVQSAVQDEGANPQRP